jgi:antitoxin VapB
VALSIKNDEVERLVEKVAALAGESKTEAVRRALVERSERLELQRVHSQRVESLVRYLEQEVWPHAPPGQLGRRLWRVEEEEILGIGPGGT